MGPIHFVRFKRRIRLFSPTGVPNPFWVLVRAPLQKLNDRQAVVEFLVGTQGFPRTVHSTGCGAFLTNRLRKAWLFYSLSNPLTGSSSRVHRNKKTPLGVLYGDAPDLIVRGGIRKRTEVPSS